MQADGTRSPGGCAVLHKKMSGTARESPKILDHRSLTTGLLFGDEMTLSSRIDGRLHHLLQRQPAISCVHFRYAFDHTRNSYGMEAIIRLSGFLDVTWGRLRGGVDPGDTSPRT